MSTIEKNFFINKFKENLLRLPLIFIRIEQLHSSKNICWSYYNTKQNRISDWFILNGFEWIVKRKRELLHEAIQSVLKFVICCQFELSYFNLFQMK